MALWDFGTSDRACKRLTLLYLRGVLERFRRWVPSGSQAWHWTLGPVGAAILSATYDTPLPRPATLRERLDHLAASQHLPHLVGTNGFFIALHAHARTHDETALAGWESERAATNTTGGAARPDGGGTWAAAGRRVAFWLEYDTGTETLARLADKLTGYAHLVDLPAARPVLFWLPTAVREQNLHAHLTRTGVPAGVTVATAAADHATEHGGPPGQVWAVVGRPGRLGLAELPQAPAPEDSDTDSGGASWGK